MSRLLGERKPTLPAGQPPGTRSTDLGPWPCRQLACLRAHAYMDTNDEPTMTQLSSKIERPLTRTPSGAGADARTTLLVSPQHTAPAVHSRVRDWRRRGVGLPIRHRCSIVAVITT